ncbi:MAG TPA: FkbM family methyltransferase [Rudaea sp.]|nr:FkbM family methyltransferase [Rudaea sp.]
MQATLRRRIGDVLTPAARAWIRYAPVALGKPWLWQTFHWRPRAFTCRTQFGDVVTGNTEDLIQRHLYFFGTWEPNISAWLTRQLRPGDCFVDIGANIGHYTLLASRLVGDHGRVVAVEAAHWIHTILERHIAMNRRSNIRTVQVAAAAARGTIKLFPGHAGNIGKTTTVARAGDSVDVQAVPLSEVLSEDEVRRTRIIKIDVEGAEVEVLRGLAPLLDRLRPDAEIVMEIAASLTPEAERTRAEIFDTMQRHGYSAYRFDNDYGVETYLRRGPGKHPFALADFAPGDQADVLFSRASY